MKKFLVVISVILVAIVLSGCVKPVENPAPVAVETAPAATMVAGYTLDEFFNAYGTSLVPALRVVSFDETTNSLSVVYNNMDVVLVNTALNAHVFVGRADGNKMTFEEMALFSQKFFDSVNGLDLVVFRTTKPYTNQTSMVVIPAGDMPKMADLQTWDKTTMEFSIWEYPMNTGFEVVQNSTTGEILIVPFVIEKNDQGHDSVVEPGRQMSAYVHFEKDANGALQMHVDAQ